MRPTAATILLLLPVAAAQTPDPSPRFEVASIKPSPPPGTGPKRTGSRGGPGTDDPSLFTCERCGLSSLLLRAFDLKDYQLSAADWMKTTRFNISATVPEGATKEQFRLMLRNLLSDRFQLKFHVERKEMQAYDLVIAKNGPRLKESVGPADPDESVPRQPGGPKIDADGFPILPPGRVPMAIIMQGGHAVARHVEETLEQFAATLSEQVRRPVTDATGLKAKYDFTLNYIIVSLDTPASEESGPSIFRAVQEQLGLKLESKKSMVDILIVDHIEKLPTEN
jgi:uncharacterized protein (TIGR03435 family)